MHRTQVGSGEGWMAGCHGYRKWSSKRLGSSSEVDSPKCVKSLNNPTGNRLQLLSLGSHSEPDKFSALSEKSPSVQV